MQIQAEGLVQNYPRSDGSRKNGLKLLLSDQSIGSSTG